MKVEISPFGKLIVTPESATEAYALKKWWNDATILVSDMERMEYVYYKGSFVAIESTKYDS